MHCALFLDLFERIFHPSRQRVEGWGRTGGGFGSLSPVEAFSPAGRKL
jgi:hypothetical protein